MVSSFFLFSCDSILGLYILYFSGLDKKHGWFLCVDQTARLNVRLFHVLHQICIYLPLYPHDLCFSVMWPFRICSAKFPMNLLVSFLFCSTFTTERALNHFCDLSGNLHRRSLSVTKILFQLQAFSFVLFPLEFIATSRSRNLHVFVQRKNKRSAPCPLLSSDSQPFRVPCFCGGTVFAGDLCVSRS